MRLEGSLDAFSLPDIFSLLSMTKKTGGLHLRRAGSHGAVWLADGLLTGGSPDLTRQSLGRRLAGSGHVSDDALAAAVNQVTHDPDLGLARVLLDAQAIDEGALHSLVCEHLSDVVFDLMRWSDGDFEFLVDEANVDDVGVTCEVDEVVTEARRRLEVWDTIEASVASTGTVLSLALDPDGEPQLSRDEWALITLVDGRRTVGELVAMSGRGEYGVVVALAELVGRGLLRANDAHGVTALVRRQELLAALESIGAHSSPPMPPPTAVAEAAFEPAVAPADPFPDSPNLERVPTGPALVTIAADDGDVEIDEADEDDDRAATQIAEVSPLTRSSDPDVDVQGVMPARSEPFMPTREPDHPEPLVAAVGGGIVAGAVPVAAGAIERDPSVNKSLLLRLIAGVRGL